jgi:hypothetical protein
MIESDDLTYKKHIDATERSSILSAIFEFIFEFIPTVVVKVLKSLLHN